MVEREARNRRLTVIHIETPVTRHSVSPTFTYGPSHIFRETWDAKQNQYFKTEQAKGKSVADIIEAMNNSIVPKLHPLNVSMAVTWGMPTWMWKNETVPRGEWRVCEWCSRKLPIHHYRLRICDYCRRESVKKNGKA